MSSSYFDLCLIFLLLRFSLFKKNINQFSVFNVRRGSGGGRKKKRRRMEAGGGERRDE